MCDGVKKGFIGAARALDLEVSLDKRTIPYEQRASATSIYTCIRMGDVMIRDFKSEIFQIMNCPVPEGVGNHHEGVDSLLKLMDDHGLKFYKTHEDTDLGGPTGLIDSSDVVLVKVNAQWKYR